MLKEGSVEVSLQIDSVGSEKEALVYKRISRLTVIVIVTYAELHCYYISDLS